MQDNAPGHAAEYTRDELVERAIRLSNWPPYSPDFNPIENLWCWMKDYLQAHFPEKMSYDRLRAAVQEAWESIPIEKFNELIDSMGARCQAVIDAEGGHTKF